LADPGNKKYDQRDAENIDGGSRHDKKYPNEFDDTASIPILVPGQDDWD
jgi:hypothetical protein